MKNILNPKKQVALIVNLALNSFPTSEDVQKLHHDFYQQAGMADILRPLAKCYLKVITNSKKDVKVSERLKSLREFLARPAITKEEQDLSKHIACVRQELTDNSSAAFDYFNTLLDGKGFTSLQQSTEEGLTPIKTVFSTSKSHTWTVDRLFLKTAKFIKQFERNYQECVEGLSERLEQQNFTRDALNQSFNIIQSTTDQKKLAKHIGSYIKAVESLLEESYEDKFILVVAKVIEEREPNKNIHQDIEKLLQQEDFSETGRVLAEKLSQLKKAYDTGTSADTVLKEFQECHNQILSIADNKRERLITLSDLDSYINASKYHQNECLNFIVRELSQKIILMVKNDEKHDLSSITGLVNLGLARNNANRLMLSILSHNDDELTDYVSSPYRSSASGMYSLLQEIPDMNVIREIEAWCKERAPEEKDYKRLLSSVTGMQAGLGNPNLDALTKLYDWCVEKTTDDISKPNIDAAIRLFGSVTSMQHGKGVPNLDDVKKLFNWCIKPLGEDGQKLELNDALSLFSSITGMQHSKGVPNLDNVKKLFNWCIKPLGEGSQELKLNDALSLFSSITGMQHGKGVPNLDDVKKLFNWCIKPLCEDNQKLELNDAINLFSSVTGMQNSRGVPKLDDIKKLFNWCIKPLGEDGQKLELNDAINLFSSVTGMQNSRGVPNLDDIKKLFNWCIKPLGENGQKLELNDVLCLFSSVTGMQNSRGVPNLRMLGELFNWCIEKTSDDISNPNIDYALSLFSSVTNMQNGKGEPNLGDVKKLFNWCIQPLGEGSQELELDKALCLFSSVTNMQNGKGEPNLGNIKKLFNWCIEKTSKDTSNPNIDAALRLFSSITGMQGSRGDQETCNNLNKINKLIEYLINRYDSLFLLKLKEYSREQLGITNTIKKFIEDYPEAKEWFDQP